jgi:hypothetical protein
LLIAKLCARTLDADFTSRLLLDRLLHNVHDGNIAPRTSHTFLKELPSTWYSAPGPRSRFDGFKDRIRIP